MRGTDEKPHGLRVCHPLCKFVMLQTEKFRQFVGLITAGCAAKHPKQAIIKTGN